MPQEKVDRLANAITEAKQKTKFCSVCGNLTDTDVCPLCSSEKRDSSVICVVEDPRDVVAMEKIREFKGFITCCTVRYHPCRGLDLRI